MVERKSATLPATKMPAFPNAGAQNIRQRHVRSPLKTNMVVLGAKVMCELNIFNFIV